MRLTLPAWVSQGEPDGARRLQDWLSPYRTSPTNGATRRIVVQPVFARECERLLNEADGFRAYWRLACSEVRPDERWGRGLFLKELLMQLAYKGGKVPCESPAIRRKRRRRVLCKSRNRAKRGDNARARNYLRYDPNTDGILSSEVFRNEHLGLSLIESIDRVGEKLAAGLELFDLEAGPVPPIRVRTGQKHAQALLLERALRDLFLRWCDRPLDALIDGGRALAFGQDDPFAGSNIRPSERFRGSRS